MFWRISANTILVVLISPLWPNSTVEPDVRAAAQTILHEWESLARQNGLLQQFQYLNYAAPFQDPVQSYGVENLELLRQVGKKYDPMHVMQNRVGGFKL